ncbi:MAG: Histone deacetylase hda1 [Sclerophora amabilis]|nr:MAG: Histone deacetylase hda1 [Sclerophora amabilis]
MDRRVSEPSVLGPRLGEDFTAADKGRSLSSTIDPAVVTNGESTSTLQPVQGVSTFSPLPVRTPFSSTLSTDGQTQTSTYHHPPAKPVWGEDKTMTDVDGDDELVKESALSVHETTRRKALPISSLRTGLCYDVRMRFHATVAEDDAHPEDPRRIYRIYRELCRAGLVNDPHALGPPQEDLMCRIHARAATPAEICLVHTYFHYKFILSTRDMDNEEHKQLTDGGDSVFFNSSSYLCAMLSAGGAIETCRAVVAGLVRNAIAVIRPPGHHAVPTEAQGFCLFNNVCVAARVCQKDFPEKCRKILIFDWDVHHGNGTQDAFYDDPDILYISIHVHQNGRFYPAGDNGDYKHCGEGPGIGMNVNMPWTDKGMGDGDYMLAFQKVVMPIASEFDPDLVIISAGFDAAAGDEIGGCFVTPACYSHMTHMLMSLAKGKVAGGYNLDSISKSALAVTRTLMGEPPDRIALSPPSRLAEDDVLTVMRHQSRYWHCMQASDLEQVSSELQGERLHGMLMRLLEVLHPLTKMSRCRSDVPESIPLRKSQDDQPLDFTEIAFEIFQEPSSGDAKLLTRKSGFAHPSRSCSPEILGASNPRTNLLDIHNTWLTDSLKTYIKWAVDQDYAVLDINVPKHLTDLDEMETTLEGDDPPSVRATKDLVIYVWENYIQVNEATHVFLMGVGDAHYGIAHLLSTYDCSPELKGVVNFIDGSTLRSVRRDTDPFIGDWYYKNSLVFVSGNHGIWSAPKPPKRKFGRVIKSGEKTLNAMLNIHQRSATAWIQARAAQTSLGVPQQQQQQQQQTSPSAPDASVATANALLTEPMII